MYKFIVSNFIARNTRNMDRNIYWFSNKKSTIDGIRVWLNSFNDDDIIIQVFQNLFILTSKTLLTKKDRKMFLKLVKIRCLRTMVKLYFVTIFIPMSLKILMLIGLFLIIAYFVWVNVSKTRF